MAKGIKDTDYLALSARIRSLENGLLTWEKTEQMLAARTVEEAVRLLREWGYGDLDPDHPEAMDASVSAAREALLADLSESVPDPRYIEIFKLPWDYHNLKAILKADAMGAAPDRLLIGAGRVKPETLTEAVRRGETDELPPRLAEAAAEGKEILDTTRDPQLSDLAVDRRCWQDMTETAGATGSGFLRGYVKTQIDAANLRALVRTLRMKKSPAFLQGALLEGGGVDTGELLKASENGGSGLAELYAGTRLRAAAECGEEALRGGDLTTFEKLCDDAAAEYLSGAQFVPFGEAPLLAYLAARETEWTDLRILLLGKRSGLDADVIRSRLRSGWM